MAGEPVLGNARQDHRDGRPLTWGRFLVLREWATRVASEHGVGVYLVGSALTKTRPRDIDVAVVWPVAEYVRLFGPIPPNSVEAEATQRPTPMALYLQHVHDEVGRRFFNLFDPCFDDRLRRVRVDVHFCPDSWWPDRDRLPLAALGVGTAAPRPQSEKAATVGECVELLAPLEAFWHDKDEKVTEQLRVAIATLETYRREVAAPRPQEETDGPVMDRERRHAYWREHEAGERCAHCGRPVGTPEDEAEDRWCCVTRSLERERDRLRDDVRKARVFLAYSFGLLDEAGVDALLGEHFLLHARQIREMIEGQVAEWRREQGGSE